MTLRRIIIIATICFFGMGLLISQANAFDGEYKVGAVFSVTGRASFLVIRKRKPPRCWLKRSTMPAALTEKN